MLTHMGWGASNVPGDVGASTFNSETDAAMVRVGPKIVTIQVVATSLLSMLLIAARSIPATRDYIANAHWIDEFPHSQGRRI